MIVIADIQYWESSMAKVMTLGSFIQSEMDKRDMGVNEFARFIDVSHATIGKFLNYGISNAYSGRPIGEPSVDFILRLAKATHTDVCYIMALIDPDAVKTVDMETRTLAETIRKLPQEVQLIVRGFITNEVSRNE